MTRLNNLVFISGPQGGGKSTFIRRISEAFSDHATPELLTRTPQFYWGGAEGIVAIDHFHRQSLKYAQRATESYEYWIAAEKHKDKLVLGDRCIYDTESYIHANIMLGNFSEDDGKAIMERLSILSRPELLEPYCIILNPGAETCYQRLQKRWEETGWIKFNETDKSYLEAVCASFSRFKDSDTMLCLQNNEETSKKKAIEWIRSLLQK